MEISEPLNDCLVQSLDISKETKIAYVLKSHVIPMYGPIEFQSYGLQSCLDIGFRMNTKRIRKYNKCLVFKYFSSTLVSKKNFLPKEILIDFLKDKR